MRRVMLTTLATVALATTGAAQTIRVTVNGDPVTFNGVGPQSVGGRILVPLRGVMEKLGAYVGFDGPSKTVTANRGDVDLTLILGERTARLNGRAVTLDVPAQQVRGSTLVPLRFMGEALGAQVLWDAPSMTVQILTDGASPTPNPDNPTSGGGNTVDIDNFSIEAPTGGLKVGSIVRFLLRGEPGGVANVQVPGLADRIPLREVSRGRYEGEYRVTANSSGLSGGAAIASLKVGSRERLIQSSENVRVDSNMPVIEDLVPATNTRTAQNRPNISASYIDEGTGVDRAQVKLTLDGDDVTRSANVTDRFVSYRPEKALKAGKHEVVLTVRDRTGNVAKQTWSFTVGNQADVVRAFNTDGTGDVRPGDVISFTLVGDPGATVVANVKGKIKNLPLRETRPGEYTGQYTVRSNDQFFNDKVTARFKSKDGEVYNVDATERLAANARPKAPSITSPADGATIGDSVTFKGKAAPGSKVRIQVAYKTSLFGVVPQNGSLGETTVDVKEDGTFTSGAIEISSIRNGKNTVYTVTFTVLGNGGRESDSETLTLKK
ncbi:MAG: copper amine oxidase N-terminal domain-containing protein [Proteobacteria bacterium]|nr:MAG: copper amine oxidase N-terminal domain-containing protein [Pseudomonadota bacterium]